MEDEGLTMYFRRNPLRALTNTCLPSSRICVTGESYIPGHRWGVHLQYSRYCTLDLLLYDSAISPFLCHILCCWLFINLKDKEMTSSPHSVSLFVCLLGNRRTQLSSCWRRSMTSRVWPLNSLNSNTSFYECELLWQEVKWRKDNWPSQRLHNPPPECLTVWFLPDSTISCAQEIVSQTCQSTFSWGRDALCVLMKVSLQDWVSNPPSHHTW